MADLLILKYEEEHTEFVNEEKIWGRNAQKKNYSFLAPLKRNNKKKIFKYFLPQEFKIFRILYSFYTLEKKPSKYLRIHKFFRIKILPTPYKTIFTIYFYIFCTKNKTTLNFEWYQYFWISIICTWEIFFFFFILTWQVVNSSYKRKRTQKADTINLYVILYKLWLMPISDRLNMHFGDITMVILE